MTEDRQKRHRDYNREWARAHPERIKELAHKSYLKTRERRIAAAREWALAHPDQRREYSRRYEEKHKTGSPRTKYTEEERRDRHNESNRRYYARHKAEKAAYRIANRDRRLSQIREWQRQHPVLLGERISLNELPPEWRQVAELTVEARKTIRQVQRGNQG